MTATCGFLDLPDGMAIRIGPAGLLIGRHRSCDIQLAAETASRRHALLRMAGDSIELVVLGRHPVSVDGEDIATTATLRDGAHLGFPGLACGVRFGTAEDSVAIAYVLQRGVERLPIRSSPFVIGGGAAHVVVEGWPSDAMRFLVAQDELFVELGEPGILNGAPLDAATPTAIRPHDTIELRGQPFRIETAGDDTASTVLRAAAALEGATLEPFPRGGRITFAFADGERTVYLPGRRYLLVAALLAPPAPIAPGDYIPDSELIPIVWNDTDEVGGRKEINVVLTRARQDLVAAGISAAKLIERAPGGRATRIAIAPHAAIRVVKSD